MSNKRIFTQFTRDDEGVPDGMTVDSEDCIWVAQFGGARVTRYSPAGEILQVLPMPALNITSCTFAGAELGYPVYRHQQGPAMSDEQIETVSAGRQLLRVQAGCQRRRRRRSSPVDYRYHV